jgi:hypothetical protein
MPTAQPGAAHLLVSANKLHTREHLKQKVQRTQTTTPPHTKQSGGIAVRHNSCRLLLSLTCPMPVTNQPNDKSEHQKQLLQQPTAPMSDTTW